MVVSEKGYAGTKCVMALKLNNQCTQVESLARAMELGEEAADRVTKEFPPPVKLEFEKVRW